MVNRCRWVPTNNKLYCDYHDKEWGKPIGDDQKLQCTLPICSAFLRRLRLNL